MAKLQVIFCFLYFIIYILLFIILLIVHIITVIFLGGLTEVIIYSSPDDRRKNRGFCFLEYDSHKAASVAKRRLNAPNYKVWGCDIIVDWADPQEEPDDETMSKVTLSITHTHSCIYIYTL